MENYYADFYPDEREQMELTEDMENNLLATGALVGALSTSGVKHEVELVIDEGGEPTNVLLVRFPFLKSAYRVTVEIVKEGAGDV